MPSHFEQFLNRARHHWTVWSILEHAGLGILTGSCCVLLLLPILLWRGQPGESVAIVLPSIGLIVGAMTGLRRRPNLRKVAQLADNRFATSDLLATALALRDSNNPWDANILKQADACSIRLSPSLLTPHRLGRRGWTGVLLAMVAAGTLGLLSITTTSNRVDAANATSEPSPWNVPENSTARAADSFRQSVPAAIEAHAETTPDSQSIQDTATPVPGSKSITSANRSSREGQTDSGGGAGSARTDSAQAVMPEERAGFLAKASKQDGSIAAAGDGRAIQTASDGSTTSGQVTATGQAAAPWESTAWPAAQSTASTAIETGQIPDAYRNMVRDYFHPADPSDPARSK